jgi:hypothetical protein
VGRAAALGVAGRARRSPSRGQTGDGLLDRCQAGERRARSHAGRRRPGSCRGCLRAPLRRRASILSPPTPQSGVRPSSTSLVSGCARQTDKTANGASALRQVAAPPGAIVAGKARFPQVEPARDLAVFLRQLVAALDSDDNSPPPEMLEEVSRWCDVRPGCLGELPWREYSLVSARAIAGGVWRSMTSKHHAMLPVRVHWSTTVR